MKTNTVLLDIIEYNMLRDFYNGINEGKFVCIEGYSSDSIYYMTEPETLNVLKKRIKYVQNEVSELKSLNRKYKNDLKRMSIWGFIKLKFS